MTIWVAVTAAVLLLGLLAWLICAERRWRRYCRQHTATLHRICDTCDRYGLPGSRR